MALFSKLYVVTHRIIAYFN